MAGKRTISKTKGVEICGDRLYAGIKPAEIIRELTETYGISVSAVEKWMKAARAGVQERKAAALAVQAKVDQEAAEASAKRLNLTKDRLMEELAKIAYGDIRNILTVDGGLKPTSAWDDETAGAVAGIESYDEKVEDEVIGSVRKVKSWDKIRAIEALNKMLGYNAPEKKDVNVNLTDGPITFE
jgi:phage terminase small subunit